MKKVLLLLTIILISCGSEESTGAEETEVVEETEEAPSEIELDKPSFEILDKHPKVECLNTVGATKFIDVFGMYVIATEESPLEKVLHTANVLAQYLDNDEDGFADDPNVLWQLVENNYVCLLYTSPSPRDRQKSRMPSSA